MGQVTSGSFRVNATYTTSGNVGNYILFSWSRYDYSSSLNCSYISWNLTLYSGGAGYISSSAPKSWSVTVNGTNYSGTNTIGIGNNTSKTLASGTTTIGHNDNGTKTFSVSVNQAFNINFNGWVGSVNGSGSFELLTIPRYAKFSGTPALSDITQTSLKISWSADSNCHYVNYYLNGEVANSQHTINGSDGSFTFTGLSPNTNYTVSVRIWRSDSDLYTSSSNISTTTLPIASLTLQNNLSLDIGEDLSLSFQNPDKNASVLKLSVEDDSGTWLSIDTAQVTVPINTAAYSWKLSELADTLYGYCTAKNDMNFKISCGVTLNGKRYENIYTGIMHVTNANPAFSACTLSNTVTSITDILTSTISTIQNLGNFRVQIPASGKALAQKSAVIIKYVSYMIAKNSSDIIKSLDADYSSTAQVDIDMGTHSISGAYQICVFAIDSRGNASPVISKDCTVISYHQPISNIAIHRVNGFEKEILLELYAQYSRLLVGASAKNEVLSVMYRYAEVGTTLPSSWTPITDYSTAIVSDNVNDATLSYIKNTLPVCFIANLPIEKSYNFEFKIADKIQPVVASLTVEQGIPIMGEFDDGHVGVGMVPDFNNEAKLQVASDIMAKDANGKNKCILEEFNKIFMFSAEEPGDQSEGFFWFRT